MTADQGFTDNPTYQRWRTTYVVPLDTVIVLSIIALCIGFVIGANAW